MDQFARLLLRMAVWVRHPPSKRMVMVAVVVIALAVVLVSLEHFGLWPDAFRVERLPRNPLPKS